MIPRILTLTALVLSAIYAYYSIDSMVLHNKTPYSFQCLGVKLDPKKNYVFSNNDRDSIQNSVLITFPYAEAIMPENLGVLSFNSTISQWRWISLPAVSEVRILYQYLYFIDRILIISQFNLTKNSSIKSYK